METPALGFGVVLVGLAVELGTLDPVLGLTVTPVGKDEAWGAIVGVTDSVAEVGNPVTAVEGAELNSGESVGTPALGVLV